MHSQVNYSFRAWGALAALAGGLHCASQTTAQAPPVVVPEAPVVAAVDVASAGEPGAEAEAASLRAGFTQVSDYWLATGRAFGDTLRGDWETSSALLVVYNATWRQPLKRLLDYAHGDLPVYVLATPEDSASRSFKRWLKGVPFAGVVSIELDTPWIRDYGPLEVQRSRGTSWLDLLYAPEDRPLDDAVPMLLGEIFETLQEREYFHLDGGGIISNGDGLCGITEVSFAELEIDTGNFERVERFLETVGCRTLARLPELPAEPTGHVDMLAQFLSRATVAIAVPTEKSPGDVREALGRARQALELAAEAHGQALTFVELPLVNRKERYYSYVNGLRTPSHYFVPSYSRVSRRLEAEAHRRLAEALPGVRVVGVNSDLMIESGGAIHCVTLGFKQDLVLRLPERLTRPVTLTAPRAVALNRR